LRNIDKWIKEAETSTNTSHPKNLKRMRGEVAALLAALGNDPEAEKLWAAYFRGAGVASPEDESGAGTAIETVSKEKLEQMRLLQSIIGNDSPAGLYKAALDQNDGEMDKAANWLLTGAASEYLVEHAELFE